MRTGLFEDVRQMYSHGRQSYPQFVSNRLKSLAPKDVLRDHRFAPGESVQALPGFYRRLRLENIRIDDGDKGQPVVGKRSLFEWQSV